MATSGLESIPSQLDELLGSEALTGSQAAVYVKRLDDGRELYARDADRLLIPASNIDSNFLDKFHISYREDRKISY